MFNESNAVELFIRDLLCGKPNKGIAEQPALYGGTLSQLAKGLGWKYQPANELHRSTTDVLLDGELRAALVRLNPEIAERPERADEVIYRLRTIF